MTKVTITHPEIPGSEVDVPESSVPFHQAAGWVVKGSPDDPEVTAAEKARDLAISGEQAKPGAEQEQTPNGRRSTRKDGE